MPTIAGVKAAIKTQDRATIHGSQLREFVNGIRVRSHTQQARAVRLLRSLSTQLDLAASAVARASASTLAESVGRANWTAGARDIAHGLDQLIAALTDAAHGHLAAANVEAAIAGKSIARGSTLRLDADKELGLPTGD